MDALAAIAELLDRHRELKVGIVFGSVARGEADFASDVDVAVLADHPLGADEKLGLIDELADVSGRPIDLLDLHDLHGPVLSRLLRHGRVLLRREPRALAALSLRAIYDEADFLPYRRRILEERRKAWIGN